MASFIAINIAVFAGALVSGFAGFAFSAIAGAILLHVIPPMEAIPLMMACSIGVQSANLWALRKSIRWRDSSAYIVGGMVGIPIAVYLLQILDTSTFRTAFGTFLCAYAGYTLFRPTKIFLKELSHRGRSAAVGFGGGLIGGLTAMPGALPTIWCDLHGMAKVDQRGLVQPFIAAMQLFALALVVSRNAMTAQIAFDFATCIPSLVAGTAIGLRLYKYVDETVFRRAILVVLFLSGISLMF